MQAGQAMGMDAPRHHLCLSVKDLTARRGGRVVAEGVSFVLNPGEGLSLRGANGSGKTSILRAIAGFSTSAEGAVGFRRSGANLDPDEARAKEIHWLGGQDGLADRLSVAESVRFWRDYLGGDGDLTDSVLTRLGLSAHGDRPAGRLSTGQRRRLGMTRLLLAPRAIWLLDEPVAGLDDQGKALLFGLIADHRATGGIVLMATHDEPLPAAPALRLHPEAIA